MSQTVLNLDGRAGQPLAEFPIENTVSLERLLTDKLPIDWFEAVAILVRACEQPELRSLSFDPAHVLVRSDGSVLTSAAGRSSAVEHSSAVQSAATLLRAVLPETFPTPLRLVLTQALSIPPSYPSIVEFAQALEYFERPDRTSVVKAVFDRWRARQEQLRIAATAAAAATPEARDETPPARHAESSTSRRRAVVWTIASAATIAGMLTLWIAFASQGIRGSGSALAKVAVSAVGTAASRVGGLIDRLGFSSSDGVDVAAAAPSVAQAEMSTAAAPAVAAPVQGSSPGTRPAQAAARPFSARPLFDPFGALTPPIVIPQAELNVFLDSQSLGITVDADGNTNPDAHPAIEPFFPSRVYSTIDADVVPPVAVYPHLPAAAFVERDGALMFEVVIDEAGKVESVRSRQAATTMGNTIRLTMNLSAAKSWRFQPAMKNGQHVKFRHTIWLPIP